MVKQGFRLEDYVSPSSLIEIMKREVPFHYDKKYWKTISTKYLNTAELVSKIRWNFVRKTKPQLVLDFGAGANFLTKFAPKEIVVDSFDIGDFPMKYTGIRHKYYDLIFLCDLLEHIPDFRETDYLFKMTNYIYISLPILPKGKSLKGWRHFKFESGEHLHYFTPRSLDLFFEAREFKKIKSGYAESKPLGPRSDILSVLYEKTKK